VASGIGKLVYSTLPLKRTKTQHLDKFLELGFSERLGEYIGHVILGRNILDSEFLVLDGFSDEMIADVDMFSASVEFVVLG